jgi:nucleotide-binding universal stress UspA family protein
MLARQMDGQLLLLHVVDERQSPSIIGRRADRARSDLQWRARQLMHIDVSRAEISVRVGKPHPTIARVAKEWDADLVVLGANRSRTGDRYFGTTAERVARAATRPVLTVNREPTRPYDSVLLATDLSDGFARVARMTQNLGLLDGVCASVVHALGPASRLMLGSAGVPDGDIGRYMDHIRKASFEELVAQFETAGLDAARFHIAQPYETPFRAIQREVEESSAELVVIGTSRYAALKRAFWRSVANEVLRKVACDVLIASPAAARRTRPQVYPARSEASFAHSALH